MNILAIETSCDDTGASIVKVKCKKSKTDCNFDILSDVISSQLKIHQKYGGVYPLLAKREHKKNLPQVLKRALKKGGFNKKQNEIDILAVTIGPGLEPCLWMGINFTEKLAKDLKLSIVPVNHIKAHIFSNWLSKKRPKDVFPAVCLVVSGGHTQLILMRGFDDYKILGETRDDAAGESLDKMARLLGLSYPGGPEVEKCATEAKKKKLKLEIEFPRPMIHHKNYDFSFSGLKTAVLYYYKKQPKRTRESKKHIQSMCLEIQQAVIDVLIHKTLKAAKEYKVKSIILGGGVTANKDLRKQFKQRLKNSKINLLVPEKKYSTDNAAMIAVAGYYQWLENKEREVKGVEAKANLRLK
jgi:N6-L-threonylcarbamoyladenine synthase